MLERPLLWIARLFGISVVGLSHYAILYAALAADITGSLAQRPGGEDLEQIHRESPEGRRNKTIINVLSWPVLKPYEIIHHCYQLELSRPVWSLLGDAALYSNSLAWGIGLWSLFEILVRGFIRPFREE